MPPRPKIYCGMQPVLPDGYDRHGLNYECLRKGYGACLYHGKLGTGIGGDQRLLFHSRSNRVLIMIIILLVFICTLLALQKYII